MSFFCVFCYTDPVPPNIANRYINDPPWDIQKLPDEENIQVDELSTKSPVDKKNYRDNTGVIVGILVGIIILLAIIVAALFYRQRKHRRTAVSKKTNFQVVLFSKPQFFILQ